MTTPRPTNSVNSRLRGSCQACAVSKVKCQKEKPACSRCVRRGTKCEYFAMRRPGRKRERSQPSNNDGDRDRANRNIELHGINGHLTNPDLSSMSSRLGSLSGTECTPSDTFAGLLTPLEPNPISGFEGENEVFDSLFTSPIDLLELESLDVLNHDPNVFSEASSFDHRNISKSPSVSSKAQSLMNGNTGASGASDSASCCLMQALDLLRKLSSSKTTGCILSKGRNDDATVSHFGNDVNLSAQTVVAENQQTFDTIRNMLQCSCMEDSYLLTMLSIIILKALERYATAARKEFGRTGEKGDKPSASTSAQEQVRQMTSGGDGSVGRLEAQLILGELHCVQRLVKQLSPRLKTRVVGVGGKGGGNVERVMSRGDLRVPSLSEGGGMAKAPFSAAIFEQLDVDLRKALSTLSLEIIDMLRQS